MKTRTLATWLSIVAAIPLVLAAHRAVHGAGPIGKNADCICVPDTHTFGYFPSKWRRWPEHGLFGQPTPAMTPSPGAPGPEPEELPTVAPPSTIPSEEPGPLPPGPGPGPTLPDQAPPTLPDEPLPETPGTTPPGPEPGTEPPAEEPTPTTPPPMQPLELPKEPLLPPPDESQDDAPPVPPQSLLDPLEDSTPRISSASRPTYYLSEEAGVDETGLPMPSRAAPKGRGDLPDVESPEPPAPQLLDPPAAAQPVPDIDDSVRSGRRRNPLRDDARVAHASVQPIGGWRHVEDSAASSMHADAAVQPAAALAPVAGQPSPSAARAIRVNPLRSRATAR